jgi:hypothetical protein
MAMVSTFSCSSSGLVGSETSASSMKWLHVNSRVATIGDADAYLLQLTGSDIFYEVAHDCSVLGFILETTVVLQKRTK